MQRIQGFVAAKAWDEYASDVLLRSAVERQFEVAGEAMSVLRKLDPATADRVPNAHKMVGMRNILIHGYAQVNNERCGRQPPRIWARSSRSFGLSSPRSGRQALTRRCENPCLPTPYRSEPRAAARWRDRAF